MNEQLFAKPLNSWLKKGQLPPMYILINFTNIFQTNGIQRHFKKKDQKKGRLTIERKKKKTRASKSAKANQRNQMEETLANKFHPRIFPVN